MNADEADDACGGEAQRVGIHAVGAGPVLHQAACRQRAERREHGRPEKPLREKRAEALGGEQLMQPDVHRAAADRAGHGNAHLNEQQRIERRLPIRDEGGQREQRDHHARYAHRCDRDLASLPDALDESDRRQLRDLREERNRREQADVPRRGAELEREADEDHAAIERAHHARPCGVLNESSLTSF